MLQFSWLTDLSQIETLRSDWDHLVQRSSVNKSFSSSIWFINRCKVFSLQPQVATAHKDKKLVGILPLIKTNLEESDQLEFVDTRLADYQDLIVGNEDHGTACELFDYVLQNKEEKSDLKLSNFHKKSNLAAALEEVELEPFEHELKVNATCPIIQIPESWEAYLKLKSSNFRKNLRSVERKLEENGLTFQMVDPNSAEHTKFVETLLQLHQQRMSSKNVKSVLDEPLSQEFLLLTLPVLLKERMLGIPYLAREGKTVALTLEVYSGSSIGTWQSGFSTKYGDLSPIKYIDIQRIRWACENKITEYDFLRGMEEYKTHWMTDLKALFSLRVKRGGK